MDKLMHLREEFDLPYAAASALEVISRPEGLPLRIMVADAARNVGDRVDGPEIQAAPPDEGADRLHEIIAERQVARRRSRPDERRLLPARSEEHTSELQSLMRISYAVFFLKK